MELKAHNSSTIIRVLIFLYAKKSLKRVVIGTLTVGSGCSWLLNEPPVNARQGLITGVNLWKILNLYFPFEWGTFFVYLLSCSNCGHTSVVKDGLIGFGLKSNQNPYLSDPTVWFSMNILFIISNPNDAGVWSVFNNDHDILVFNC